MNLGLLEEQASALNCKAISPAPGKDALRQSSSFLSQTRFDMLFCKSSVGEEYRDQTGLIHSLLIHWPGSGPFLHLSVCRFLCSQPGPTDSGSWPFDAFIFSLPGNACLSGSDSCTPHFCMRKAQGHSLGASSPSCSRHLLVYRDLIAGLYLIFARSLPRISARP